MREVAIVSPVRTAVGSFGGGMRDIPAAELGSIVIKEVLSRTGLDPAEVDDVILGHGYPSGEDPAVGRLGGPEGRTSHRGPRLPVGPPVLFGPAGHP